MKILPAFLAIVSICLGTAASTAAGEPITPHMLGERTIETTGYYKTASSDTTQWLRMSLKLKVNNTPYGEVYEVVGTKLPFDYGWMTHYTGNVASRVQAPLSKTYSHSVLVRGYTVYFNLC